MNDDEDLEARLRRYRVAEPPPTLGEKVGQIEAPEWAGRLWGPAAAAAVLTLWLAAHAAAWEPSPDPVLEEQVAHIERTLGGGEDARRYAEGVVSVRRPRMDPAIAGDDVVSDAMRVRPPLRRFLLWVGPVLALIVMWQVWDAVERNRLERQLAATFPEGLVNPDRPWDEENAARYYTAASIAVLWADTELLTLPVLWGTRGALGRGDAQAVPGADRAVKLVAANQLSLNLVERAGALPFGAFRPGTDFNYRFGGLVQVAQLSAFKTLDAIRRSDVSAAVASVTARIKLLRAFDAEGRYLGATVAASERQGIAADTALLVSRIQPSDAQLDGVSQVLREIAPTDLDHVVKHDGLSRYNAFRYGSFDRSSWYYATYVVRPIVRHHMVESMTVVAEVREAVRLPWPDRLAAMKAMPERRSAIPEIVPFIGAWRLQSVLRDMTPRVAAGVAAGRCARLAVALEQHRRSHGAYPGRLDELTQDLGSDTRVDPFTGKPFVYQPSKVGYVLYSVGPDGRDDGGQVFPVAVNGRVLGTVPAPDVGVRVRMET